MTEACHWCETPGVQTVKESVFWELPDGSSAIEIQSVPSRRCTACSAVYQDDETVKGIENHLFIIDTSKLERILTYEELMAKPKLLKRNYFDFS